MTRVSLPEAIPADSRGATAVPVVVRRDARHAVAAWSLWAAIALASLALVMRYGLTMPTGDEWAWIPMAAGDVPVTWSWLWSQHNEHRMALPRLVYLGLGWLTGFDFRAGAIFNVAALAALAAAMMLTARKLRGSTRVYDAFFPLILLHWSQAENLVWGFQLNFVLSVSLAGTALLVMLRAGATLRLGTALVVAAILLLLGLTGMYGVAYLPALAAWLFAGAALRWSQGGPGARAKRRRSPHCRWLLCCWRHWYSSVSIGPAAERIPDCLPWRARAWSFSQGAWGAWVRNFGLLRACSRWRWLLGWRGERCAPFGFLGVRVFPPWEFLHSSAASSR